MGNPHPAICLENLLALAVPLLKRVEQVHPRSGPGRKPEVPDWVLGLCIVIAVLHRKKCKSAQHRFLVSRQKELLPWLDGHRFPTRSMYCRRYRRAYELFEWAIHEQAGKAIAEGFVDPQQVAVDKSLIAAQGPLWHPSDRRKNRIPDKLKGVDREGTWCCSSHTGWVQGYGYTVIVSATPDSPIFPLEATVHTAAVKEYQLFDTQVDRLPKGTQFVCADTGFDTHRCSDRVELTEDGRPTGRRFLCPARRSSTDLPRKTVRTRREQQRYLHRQNQQAFLKTRRGRRLYGRRRCTVEPFHEQLKSLFELQDRVWHRGLDNNRTQLLATIFSYQLLVRWNFRHRRRHNQIKILLDIL